MNNNELWSNCNFFKQSFKEQVDYSELRIKDHFDSWSKTLTAKTICKEKMPESIEDLPITEYGDYPILATFKEKIEEKERSKSRINGELWHDYYTRILSEVSYVVEGYLPDKPAICIKTTGTTGTNKLIVHGERFLNEFISDTIVSLLMATSKEWGEDVLKEKMNVLNLFAPVPYLSGWALRYWENLINFVPSISVTDNLSDMGKKFQIALQTIEKGNKIHVIGGSGSLLYMACQYFENPQYFFEQSLRLTSSKYKKILIFLKLMLGKLERKKVGNLEDIMPLKSVVIGSTDAQIYAQFLREKFNIEPFNYYAATEIGCSMLGRLNRKIDLLPNLRAVYMEFLDEKGELKKVYEVKKDNVYELVATPYYSMFVRYRIKDLFRVIDFLDGSPVFSFEGRTQNMIDVYNYYRFSEDLITKVLVNAGFKSSDRWAITKILQPREMLEIFFEKEWSVSERQAQKLIFDSMLALIPGFNTYVHDFNIMDPSEVLKVQFLEKGTFTRYTMKQVRKNVPLGQYKPLKIVTPDKKYILEELMDSSING